MRGCTVHLWGLLTRPPPSCRYADDIYGGDEEGADELLNMVEEQEGDGEAEPADE